MEPVLSSIEGSWIGSFDFADARLPVPLESKFIFENSTEIFAGSTSDPGPRGHAIVEGRLNGKAVIFITYHIDPKTSLRMGEVQYDGTLTKDQNTIEGTWRTLDKAYPIETGTWKIFRADAERQVSGESWPLSENKLASKSLVAKNPYLEAMTAKVYGGQMTLVKPAPALSSNNRTQLPPGVAFGLSIASLILTIATAFGIISIGPSRFLTALFLLLLVASISLAAIAYKLYNASRYGLAYVLDRNGDTFSKNSKKIGAFSQIAKVEVKTLHNEADASSVTVIMKDGRRVPIETGRSSNALALSNDIGQFVGVDVIAIV